MRRINNLLQKLKEPFFYTIMASFIILCSSLFIIINQFTINENYSEKTESEGVSPPLTDEMIIHQEINIKGRIDTLHFQFQFKNIDDLPTGTISILVKNNKNNILKKISINDISKQNKISINLPKKLSTPFDIYISSQDIDGEIMLKTRSESLLGQYDINGTIQNGNLLIGLKTTIIPRYSYLRIILFVCMLFAFLFQLYTFYVPSSPQREKKLYWIAFIFIFCNICIRYPANTLLAEPYLETVSNFFHQTLTRGFKGSFFLDDAGYWPILSRLVAEFVVLVIHQNEYAILIFAIICLLCIVFVTTEIVKSRYNKYIFIEARFIIALLMGGTCYYQISQMLYLHNLGYLSIFIVIYAFLNDLEKISLPKWILLIIITIISTGSKTYYIGLIPLMFLLLLLKRKQLSIKKVQYCFICCIGPSCQILYLLSGLAEDSYKASNRGIFYSILESCYTYVQCFFYLFKDIEKNASTSGFVWNALVVILLGWLLAKCVRMHKNNISIYCIGLFLWGLGITFINAIYGRLSQTINITYLFRVTSYTGRRIEFLVYVGILFFLFLIVSDRFLIEYNCQWKKVLLSLVLVLLVGRFSTNLTAIVNEDRATNWLKFSKMLENPSYAIPVGDRDGFIVKNANVYYCGERELAKSNVRLGSKPIKKEILNTSTISSLNIQKTLKEKAIISIFVKKQYITQPDEIRVFLFDDNNNILAYADGIAEYDRSIIGFDLKKEVYNVSHIEFYCKSNDIPYELKSEIFIAATN